MIDYHELENHFKAPKDWKPGMRVFGRHKRLPRKKKKLGQKWDLFGMTKGIRTPFYKKYHGRKLKLKEGRPLVGLWYRQHCLNENYNRFLIKLICEN